MKIILKAFLLAVFAMNAAAAFADCDGDNCKRSQDKLVSEVHGYVVTDTQK